MGLSQTPGERLRRALQSHGIAMRPAEFESGTETAAAASNAVGCEQGQIVKTLFFLAGGRPTIALVAGDRQADTARLASLVGVGRKKLRMGTPTEVLEYTGYAVGGVAPVGLAHPCDVVIDESLRRFETLWAAAGTGNAVFPVATEAIIAASGGQLAAITREAS